ncbi:Uncharacterised protein [Bordetella pertussis]|nr:Uncharacterised protein [Bordetella pertussis]
MASRTNPSRRPSRSPRRRRPRPMTASTCRAWWGRPPAAPSRSASS